MAPGLRKLALTAHIVSSVGWIGAVLAYLALVATALGSAEAETVRSALLAMEMTYMALVPLAFAALVTGVLQSLGTHWGLVRHYWVAFKLVLTVLATIVLLMNMQTVTSIVDAAAQRNTAALGNAAGGQLLHAGVGLVVLLITTLLAVYKPRAMTRYGWRKQQARRKPAAAQG